MKDNDIIVLYFQRDERAVAETQNTYEPSLMSIATRMINLSDAQECVNDTYLAAWDSIPPTRPHNLFGWLAKTCRNLVCNKIDWNSASKRSAETLSISGELADILSGPDDNGPDSDARLLGQSITSYLRTLSKENRTLFLRRYFYNRSIKELAGELNCSESNVKTKLHRIRHGLRKHLIKEGFAI